ncbi:MAG: hypothetical protein WCV50_06830 [Patescibacteria group bacterium]
MGTHLSRRKRGRGEIPILDFAELSEVFLIQCIVSVLTKFKLAKDAWEKLPAERRAELIQGASEKWEMISGEEKKRYYSIISRKDYQHRYYLAHREKAQEYQRQYNLLHKKKGGGFLPRGKAKLQADPPPPDGAITIRGFQSSVNTERTLSQILKEERVFTK